MKRQINKGEDSYVMEFSLDPPQQGILTDNSTAGETQPPQHRLAHKLSAAGMGGEGVGEVWGPLAHPLWGPHQPQHSPAEGAHRLINVSRKLRPYRPSKKTAPFISVPSARARLSLPQHPASHSSPHWSVCCTRRLWRSGDCLSGLGGQQGLQVNPSAACAAHYSSLDPRSPCCDGH